MLSFCFPALLSVCLFFIACHLPVLYCMHGIWAMEKSCFVAVWTTEIEPGLCGFEEHLHILSYPFLAKLVLYPNGVGGGGGLLLRVVVFVFFLKKKIAHHPGRSDHPWHCDFARQQAATTGVASTVPAGGIRI